MFALDVVPSPQLWERAKAAADDSSGTQSDSDFEAASCRVV